MKHYVKLAVLIPLIIVCIGVYYVAGANSAYPEFELRGQKGNDKEALPVSLYGNNRNEAFIIDAQGSHFQSEQSFWKSLDFNYHYNPEMQKLAKEHRDFMRGKRNLLAVYEDEKIIGYADIEERKIEASGVPQLAFDFDISVYDKQKRSSSSFKVNVPQKGMYDSISPYDVQIEGQTMKMVAKIRKSADISADRNSSSIEELHLYTFDLGGKKVVEDQTLISGASAGEDTQVRIRTVYESETTQKGRYAVIDIQYSKKNAKKELTMDKRDIVYCDVWSGQMSVMREPIVNELVDNEAEFAVRHTGDELYLTSWLDPKRPRVVRYNLVENKVKADVAIKLDHIKSDEQSANHSKIANNRLYTLISQNRGNVDNPTLIIADLNTGNIVYEGILSRKDNKPLEDLMIYDLYVQ